MTFRTGQLGERCARMPKSIVGTVNRRTRFRRFVVWSSSMCTKRLDPLGKRAAQGRSSSGADTAVKARMAKIRAAFAREQAKKAGL